MEIGAQRTSAGKRRCRCTHNHGTHFLTHTLFLTHTQSLAHAPTHRRHEGSAFMQPQIVPSPQQQPYLPTHVPLPNIVLPQLQAALLRAVATAKAAVSSVGVHGMGQQTARFSQQQLQQQTRVSGCLVLCVCVREVCVCVAAASGLIYLAFVLPASSLHATPLTRVHRCSSKHGRRPCFGSWCSAQECLCKD